MKKLLAVFWDVDGTLADTELNGHRVAFNLSFKDYDLDWTWNERIYKELLMISGGLNRIIHYRNQTDQVISDKICKKLQIRKRFHYKELINKGVIKPRNGVLRLIEEIGSRNVEQYIVTTSGLESLQPFLNTSMPSHKKYFSGSITYEDVKNHKPSPEAYKLALKTSNKLACNCLAIEDSTIGVDAAKAANLKCLMTIPTWLSSYEKITYKADSCVDSLGSVEEGANLIYGKNLITKMVNFDYLSSILN